MAEPLKDKETVKIKYTIGNSPDYEDGYEQGFKDGKREVWIPLVIYAAVTCLSLFFVSKCNAQNTTDTIPVSLLVRIQGRPWAFFHDGWEVRRVSEDAGKYLPMQEPCTIPGCAVYHPWVLRPGKTYSHLLYLDSKKRPIRKEWVIYQTFKR